MKIISRRARPYTITLYNYLSATNGVATYQKTVIEHVYLDIAYQQRLAQKGVSTNDTAQLIIDLRDIKTTNNRTFIDYQAWKQLTSLQKLLYFTFAIKEDFFVVGEAIETLPDTTKKDMIDKYQCLSVSSVAIPASDKSGAVVVEVVGK